ncbi:MAG: tetratricopeptide repeat protein, partial [Gemmatimonadales bacterium]
MTELLQAAQTALRGADRTTARARYEACLAQDPDSAAAWEGLG